MEPSEGIRTKQDKGIVVILDPRVLTKNYGNAFLRALPEVSGGGGVSGEGIVLPRVSKLAA